MYLDAQDIWLVVSILLSVLLTDTLFNRMGGDFMADKYNIFGKGGQTGKVMRTVYFTLCEGYELNELNGRQLDYHDCLVGQYTPRRATKFFNRSRSNRSIKITRTHVYSQLVYMDFWEFWQYAMPSSDPKLVKEYVLDNLVSTND